jgi:hypothetical protein
MAIEQTRAQMKGSIWQAIAQSGVDLSAIPQEQQELLVNKIADNVLVAVNTMLDEIPRAQPVETEVNASMEEQILWKGHPFLSIVEDYVVTTERVKVIKGMLSRDIENFELIRIQDIDLSQAVTERMLGLGDITIRGHDPSDPSIVLRNIPRPEEVYEILRKAWLEARKRHGLQFREYM